MERNNTSNIWADIEKIAKTLSLIAIPIVIAILGWLFQERLKTKDVSKDYVELAVTILTKSEQSKIDPAIRAWAVDLLNQNSPTKFPDDVARRLKAGELSLTETLGAIAAESSGGMAVSPDGVYIAIGTLEGEILLFNGRTGAQLSKIKGHLDRVTGVAFSSDQRLLASGSFDNTVRIFELANLNAPPKTLTGHTAGVIGVAFAPDGQTLYSRSFDNTIIQWDVSSGKPIMKLLAPGL